MTGRFDGRVALVTGAGRGIGRGIAARLASEGAAVVVNDLDAAVATEAADAIAAAGGAAAAAPGSVADVAVCESMVATAEDAFGGLDFVVNNAGITADAWVHKMSDELWDLSDGVNLRGQFQVCRAAARLLRVPRDVAPAHHRKVVNIASINGLHGVAGNTNYSAHKAGVIGFTKALAREWAPLRINVNAVAPGFIQGTRLTSLRQEGEVFGVASEEIIAAIEASIPIGRGGQPEDIAGVVAFLCSTDSDYVTGQVIAADGGRDFIQVT